MPIDFFQMMGTMGMKMNLACLSAFKPGKKDVVVEEDVVTATEESSASGVGPLALEEEDQFDIGKQLAPSAAKKDIVVKEDTAIAMEEDLASKDRPLLSTDYSSANSFSLESATFNLKNAIQRQAESLVFKKPSIPKKENPVEEILNIETERQERKNLLTQYAVDNTGIGENADVEEYNRIINEGMASFDEDMVPGRKEILGDTKSYHPRAATISFDDAHSKAN